MTEMDATTWVVHAGRPGREADAPVGPAVTFTSTYVAGGEIGYGRFGNPTWSAFEDVIGELEGGRALAFASGMGATAAVCDLVPVGGRVVAPRHAYSGTLGLLDRQAASGRIALERIDIADTAAVAKAMPGTALLWAESPTNPAIEVADLAAITAAAHAEGAIVAVDNTFATPLLQRPLDFGADIVVHSATKFLSGHSDVLLGVVVGRDDRYDDLAARRRDLGAIPGPMEAWLALRGVRTLALRLDRSQQTAAILADRLAADPRISRVRYPGLMTDAGYELASRQMKGYGAVLAVEVAGGAEAAQRVCENVRLWIHATSLGGIESMLERRRRWPAEAETIPADLLRLSVGIEHVEDLWNDLDQALEKAGQRPAKA